MSVIEVVIVFLAGFALFPSTDLENVLLRTAAGVTAAGILYARVLAPVFRWAKNLIDAVYALIEDVRELKTDLGSHLTGHEEDAGRLKIVEDNIIAIGDKV